MMVTHSDNDREQKMNYVSKIATNNTMIMYSNILYQNNQCSNQDLRPPEWVINPTNVDKYQALFSQCEFPWFWGIFINLHVATLSV